MREELRAQAHQIALDRAAEDISPEDVAAELDLPWPVEPPDDTRTEVKERLDRKLAEKVDARYPRQKFAEIRKTIESQHPVKEKGDDVSFVIRGGRGSAPEVEGQFRDITSTHVRIGDRWVLRSDMKERDLAMFDPDIRTKLVEEKVRRESLLYTEKREDYADSIKRDHYIEGFRVAGYVYHNGTFVAASELLDQTVQAEIEKKAKRMQPDVEREIFEAAGFVFKEGEWQPSAVKRTLGLLKGKS